MEELPPHVTLAEVAAVGVSLSTISKVLNGRRDVASATRAESLLEQNGYLRRGNETARAAGIRVPEQHSTVRYDDVPLAKWSGPSLTTVHQRLQKMAEEAARLILRLCDGAGASGSRMELATHLVVRDGTAPLVVE